MVFNYVDCPRSPTHDAKGVVIDQHGCQCMAVISAELILGSVHLIPRFGCIVPQEWNSFTVLEQCESFYVNPFKDIDTYLTFM